MAAVPVSQGVTTYALNPTTGMVHAWHCGLGPARAGAAYADGYVAVSALVLGSIKEDHVCSRCLPREVTDGAQQ